MVPSPLASIDCWIFDLDNSLYPASANLFELIDVRMGEYIAQRLGCTMVEARIVQKGFFRDHGTTLAGLTRLLPYFPGAGDLLNEATPALAQEPWATYRGNLQRTGNTDGKAGPATMRYPMPPTSTTTEVSSSPACGVTARAA